MDQVWWNGVFNANRMLEDITAAMLQGRSVFLTLPSLPPWHTSMRREIVDRLRNGNARNSTEIITCPDTEIGKYLFDNYCRREKRIQYRKKDSYAKFLAKDETSVLNNRYLYITETREDRLQEWREFLVQYLGNTVSGQGASFLLEIPECMTTLSPIHGVDMICYPEYIDTFDQYAFCALASTKAEMPRALRPYLAEMARAVGAHDTELSAACIEKGLQFLQNPNHAIEDIFAEELRSDGSQFTLLSGEDDLSEAIWSSQLKILFPKIQQLLRQLIYDHEEEILETLPMQTSYAATINDPADVEPGHLSYLVSQGSINLTPAEYNVLVLIRDVRNSLAHMKSVPFEQVEKILTDNKETFGKF